MLPSIRNNVEQRIIINVRPVKGFEENGIIKRIKHSFLKPNKVFSKVVPGKR
jgi:hypothetical protein